MLAAARTFGMAACRDTGHGPVAIAWTALVVWIGLRFAVKWLGVAIDTRRIGVVGLVEVTV